MEFYSPLRYPGGKGKVADYFKQIFKDNSLYDGIYIEPFAGGASVALSLLFNEYASKVIINDKDYSIYSFWHSVLNETDELCRLINDTDISVETWDVQKAIQKGLDQHTIAEVGFSTFFLNRTNRSGIIKGGIIGGRNQDGAWKMDARFNKKDLIKRIVRIAQFRNRIDLHNCDALDLVGKLRDTLPAKSLFYFDPPYYVKGKDLYLNYFRYIDHKTIANEISKVTNQKWIVTYDYVTPICDLYHIFRQKKFNLNYSAAKASVGEEVMIFSDNINIATTSLFCS